MFSTYKNKEDLKWKKCIIHQKIHCVCFCACIYTYLDIKVCNIYSREPPSTNMVIKEFIEYCDSYGNSKSTPQFTLCLLHNTISIPRSWIKKGYGQSMLSILIIQKQSYRFYINLEPVIFYELDGYDFFNACKSKVQISLTSYMFAISTSILYRKHLDGKPSAAIWIWILFHDLIIQDLKFR